MKRGDNSKDNDLNLAALENILIGAYDAFVEENVEIRSQAGLTETITREAIGGCCEWCSKLAGTYRYGEEPKEIYQKHDNCTCVVTAKTDKGYTDVWSKKQYKSQLESRKARIKILEGQGGEMSLLRAKALNGPNKRGTIDIEIDKFTSCLEDAKTGKILDTEVCKINNKSILKGYNTKNGWNVNWQKLVGECDVYALTLKGDAEIQGLIALGDSLDTKSVVVRWVSAAPWNAREHAKGEKKYLGVGGHLFAIAAEKALEIDPERGWVSGSAKNAEKLKMFIEKFHAKWLPWGNDPYRFIIDTTELRELLKKYTYEWKK